MECPNCKSKCNITFDKTESFIISEGEIERCEDSECFNNFELQCSNEDCGYTDEINSSEKEKLKEYLIEQGFRKISSWV